MAISLVQHRRKYTQVQVAKFSDDKQPKMGLAAFFPSKTTKAKMVSIEVQRNKQKVAVDVMRCVDPVRNTFSRSTEKIFMPPFYNEMFDFTACERYEETYGSGEIPNRSDLARLSTDTNENLLAIKNKILRAIEIQRSQVLQTGIVNLKNGDSIDYKRKAESMKVLTGTDRWGQADANIYGDLEAGLQFIRSKGLSGATAVNAIFGSEALSRFMRDEKALKQADYRRINRIDIGMPQFNNTSGMVYHGQIGTGDYIVNIWSYNDTYEHPVTGVETPYIDPQNVIMVSDDFKGLTSFGGIPAIMGNEDSGKYVGIQEGEFYVRDIIDQVKTTWDFIVASAPLVIPVSIDRIYTLNVGDADS